jgi:hypothetical protein
LIPGIHRDMLDGTILHFLPVDANVILFDRWNLVGEGSYGKIFKFCICRIDFIPNMKYMFAKYLKILMKVTLQHQKSKRQ